MISRRVFIQFIASAVVAKSLLAKSVSVMAQGMDKAVLAIEGFSGFAIGDLFTIGGFPNKRFIVKAIEDEGARLVYMPA